MAKFYATRIWQEAPITTGCIQNITVGSSIEVSDEPTDGSGQIVLFGEHISWTRTTVYIKINQSTTDRVETRVSPFVEAVGNGGPAIVEVTQTVTSGDKIGEINIDDVIT